MQVLRAADRVAKPWKNGGGVTREVAVFPLSAGMDDFEWRLSIADIAAPGPFSRFDGVDRVLTVLDGRLAMQFDERTVELLPGQPFAFPGDMAAYGTPIGGPVRDLNVMVRRDLWRARVEPWRQSLHLSGICIVLAVTSSKTIAMYDALQLDANDTRPGDLAGFLIQIELA